MVREMFESFKKIVEKGASSHICDKLGDYILVYGGSNFENKYDRVVYNDYYIFDLEFNLLKHSKGKIFPESGIKITEKDCIWYILKDTIYKIYIKNLELVEEEIFKLDHNFDSGFGCIYEKNLIFGKDKMFKLNIDNKELTNLKSFIGKPRSQSVYSKYKNYIYVLGGASNEAYLDTYRYNIEDNNWEKLNDLEISLLGASSIKIDEENLLIIGGFNKEVYDKAVIDLKDPDYKKIYFEIEKEKFRWNNKILKYNFKDQKFSILEENELSALCGSSIVKILNTYYVVLGEIKPGLRSKFVYKYKLEGK